MADQAGFLNLICISIFGGAAGWIVYGWGKGSGMGLFWDMAGGVLGGFLGASLAYHFDVNANGPGAVIGVGFLGSAAFLLLQWVISIYRKPRHR
jgi:uncharacterized membrane protein YeaQ/YmgE (transglycosylase-associated protein family)